MTAQKRGRPTKPATDDDSVNRRREKMRDMQRASRKRRGEHQNGLQQRVQMLEATIEEMAASFLDMSDTVLNSGALRGQPRRVEAVRAQIARFMSLATNASSEPTSPCDEAPTWSSPGYHDGIDDRDDQKQLVRPKWRRTSAETASKPEAYSSITRGHFSPKLTYLMPSQSVSLPALDAAATTVACVAAGQDSFLGRLYWKITVSALQALRGEVPGRARITFRYSMRYATAYNLAERAYKAMQMMLYGQDGTDSMSVAAWPDAGPLPQAQLLTNEEDLEANLRAAIELDVQHAGRNMDDYVGTVELENYLRLHWGIVPSTDTLRLTLPPGRVSSGSVRSTQSARMPDTPSMNYSPRFYPQEQRHRQSPRRFDVGTAAVIAASDAARPLHEPYAPRSGSTKPPDILANRSTEVTLGIEKLMEGLNLASVCFGDETRFERHAVDMAAMAVLQQAAVV